MGELRTVVEGLQFAEGPRWHAGRLWFSEMYGQRVLSVDPHGGEVRTEAEVPGQPSGLGWLPDDRLLVVSMRNRRLLRREDGGELVEVADLSRVATFDCNDMVVDRVGRAYVGNFGFDLHGGEEPRSAAIARVDPDGAVTIAADDLAFPNGTVITPDGGTLIVAETFGSRLTAFDVGPDGSLSNRRVWAQLEGAVPDGICLDAEAAVWCASPVSNEVLRVSEGGSVQAKVLTGDRGAYACMLGGDDGRDLFVCTATTFEPGAGLSEDSARIEVTRVEVAGAGLP